MNVKIKQADGTIASYWGVTDIHPGKDNDWLLHVKVERAPVRIDGELVGCVDRCAYNQPGIDEVLDDQLARDKYDVTVFEWVPVDPVASISEYVTDGGIEFC
jgi:hypothetical protein